MRVMKAALASIVALALTLPVAWQERAIARTRLENRDRADFLAQLRSEPEAGTAPAQADMHPALEEHAELERLRTLAAALRSRLEQAREARPAAVAKDAGQLALRPGFTSAREARDVGSATTEAMFQTVLWALGRGDTNRMLDLTDWYAEGGQKELLLQSVADAAAEATHMRDIQFRVIRQVALPDGDVAVVIEVARGNSLQRVALRARYAGAQWRLVVDRNGPQAVDLGEDLNRD